MLFQTQGSQLSAPVNVQQSHVYHHGFEPVEELNEQIAFLPHYGARM